jgi:hypothetical protein
MCTTPNTPPSVLRPDWKILPRLASMWNKPLDLDTCPAPSSSSIGFVVQPIDRSPLGFETQTKKPSLWFWGPNHQTVAADFETLTGKPATTGFVSKPGEPAITGFEAKPGETGATDFKAKLEETVTMVLKSNHWQIIPVVLRPNHRQTVDFGFEAQPRNSRFSSPCALCRLHTTSSDLSIVWPLSTQPVWPSPVLYIRSSTLVMILVAICNATPATCTPQNKQIRFSKRNKDKGKNWNVPNSNSNLIKSMTHHNQTKKLTTWFLI